MLTRCGSINGPCSWVSCAFNYDIVFSSDHEAASIAACLQIKHTEHLYTNLSTRQTLRRRQKSGGDSMSRPGFRRPQREGSEYALLSPGGAGTCANSARVILPVLRTMPFLSHCRGCVRACVAKTLEELLA